MESSTSRGNRKQSQSEADAQRCSPTLEQPKSRGQTIIWFVKQAVFTFTIPDLESLAGEDKSISGLNSRMMAYFNKTRCDGSYYLAMLGHRINTAAGQ